MTTTSSSSSPPLPPPAETAADNVITPPSDTKNPTTPAESPTPASATPKTPEPPHSDDVAEILIYIPSYSRWFSWNNIHECEVRFLPEFFDSKTHSRNPRVYKYYRNSIVKSFRQNPTRKITFTEARKTIIGDVGSIRRVFDFLEIWGLINYTPTLSKQGLKWDEKETKLMTAALAQGNSEAAAGSGGDYAAPKRRLCGGCKTVCSIACFISEKNNLTLCARCYVRGNNRAGVNPSDFRRVEIDDEVKTDWTDKETLQLLEAAMHFGDDWKKVSEYVSGRTQIECIAQFIKLPFGEQFAGQEFAEANKVYQSKGQNDPKMELETSDKEFPNKKARLNPLADASNPIMAQAAFLSALGGVELTEVAAQAAVNSLSESSRRTLEASLGSLSGYARQQGVDAASNGDADIRAMEKMQVDARSELDKEEMDLERAISYITDVQLKEIQDKILKFEEGELLMEREWEQLQQMKHQLFVDQLTFLFHRNAASKAGETVEPNTNTG